MTEAKWLACADPLVMLDHPTAYRGWRKLRLFACACARRHADYLTAGGERAVFTAEQFADGLRGAADLSGAFAAVEEPRGHALVRRSGRPFGDPVKGPPVRASEVIQIQAETASQSNSTEPVLPWYVSLMAVGIVTVNW